jgi:ABC-type lipoprotein export system ATPase subunit
MIKFLDRNFLKLKESFNYKTWARNMTFVLQSTQLISYVDKTRVIFLEIEIEKIKNENEKEVSVMNFDIKKKIWKRKEERVEYQEKIASAAEYMRRMCHEFIQIKILSENFKWIAADL